MNWKKKESKFHQPVRVDFSIRRNFCILTAVAFNIYKPMRINIRQKDIEITSSLREYLNMKIVRPVEKLLKRTDASQDPVLDIEVSRTTRHHHKGEVYRVSATLGLGGKTIRASAEESEAHAACDILEDELKREITHFKTSSLSMAKRLGRRAKQFLRVNPAAWFRRGKRDWHEGN